MNWFVKASGWATTAPQTSPILQHLFRMLTIQPYKACSMQVVAQVISTGYSFSAKPTLARQASEALIQTLPHWPVLHCWPHYHRDKAPLSETHLVIFVDDLQDFAFTHEKNIEGRVMLTSLRTTALRTLLATIRQDIECLVVVATCRREDEAAVRAALGQLFEELLVIELRPFNKNPHSSQAARIIDDFQKHGSTHHKDWDGTLGSLVLGFTEKRDKYLKIMNAPAAVVLCAMKLLTRANTFVHTRRCLQAVCEGVFGEKALMDEKTWREAVNRLEQEQFITKEKDGRETRLVIRQDTYFDQVITGYLKPNQLFELEQGLVQLQDVLVLLNDANALANLSEAFTDLKLYDQALAAYEQAIRLDPNVSTSYCNKGVILFILKRYDEALAAFERAIRLDPNLAPAYYNKGISLTELKHHEEALATFNQAIDLDPNYVSLHYNKGNMFKDLQRYDEALAAYEQAIRLNSSHALAYRRKGDTLVDLQRSEEALVAYEQAIRLDPTDAVAYNNKGNALSKLKRYDEALAAFEQATGLDPGYTFAYYNKGLLLVDLQH